MGGRSFPALRPGGLKQAPDGQRPPHPPLETFLQVAAGEEYTCGVKKEGGIQCWGLNGDGQAPELVEGEYVQVAAGWRHGCGLTVNGKVKCWGYNHEGQTEVPEGLRREEEGNNRREEENNLLREQVRRQEEENVRRER